MTKPCSVNHAWTHFSVLSVAILIPLLQKITCSRRCRYSITQGRIVLCLTAVPSCSIRSPRNSPPTSTLSSYKNLTISFSTGKRIGPGYQALITAQARVTYHYSSAPMITTWRVPRITATPMAPRQTPKIRCLRYLLHWKVERKAWPLRVLVILSTSSPDYTTTWILGYLGLNSRRYPLLIL